MLKYTHPSFPVIELAAKISLIFFILSGTGLCSFFLIIKHFWVPKTYGQSYSKIFARQSLDSVILDKLLSNFDWLMLM